MKQRSESTTPPASPPISSKPAVPPQKKHRQNSQLGQYLKILEEI